MTTDHRCSFCNKREKEVRALISREVGGEVKAEGPHICDECIGLSLEILAAKGIDLVAERIADKQPFIK
jgi:ATP-dependent protease Clp ATPase subunit